MPPLKKEANLKTKIRGYKTNASPALHLCHFHSTSASKQEALTSAATEYAVFCSRTMRVFPWFILVPEVDDHIIELHQLDQMIMIR